MKTGAVDSGGTQTCALMPEMSKKKQTKKKHKCNLMSLKHTDRLQVRLFTSEKDIINMS